jgi:hypothetical protein
METLIFIVLILLGLILIIMMGIPQNTKKQAEKDKQLFSPKTKVRNVHSADRELIMDDNGGTRLEPDRRKFKYAAYIPEKRSDRDRRKGFDHRSPITRRRGVERRSILNHRRSFPVERRDMFKTRF